VVTFIIYFFLFKGFKGIKTTNLIFETKKTKTQKVTCQPLF